MLNVAHLRKVAASRGDTSDYSIAKRSGVSTSTMSRLVRNEVDDPRTATLLKLGRAYNLTLDELLADDEMPAAA
jgi:transcriptional regulator with XRE-family HTH domain